MSETFVVVGGDAAGMSAASKAKRENPDLDVVVFERGEWVAYGACGLPYYVKGEVESLEDLVSIPPERFVEDRDIDLRLHHEVTGIDVADRTVTVETDGESFDQSYESLLISTGAHAVVPPVDGLALDGVFTLHDMADGARIREYVTDEECLQSGAEEGYGAEAREYRNMARPESVGIVGAGYVGMEMAEALAARGLDVTVVEMLDHVLAPFGEASARVGEDHLREQGVTLHLGETVERLAGESGRVAAIETDAGRVSVDMVLVGAGVAPNTDLAEEAGIELGATGAIATDRFGRTSAPDVYAAGDCAEAYHVVTGTPDHVPLALTANRAGRAIGQTVTGDPSPVGPIAGTAVTKVFDMEVARTGVIDHEKAEEAGFDPVSKTVTAPSRAHYYPGGSEVTVTLTGDRETGRLLGASMAGREGVAKRIDTVATALYSGLTVGDVESLDLAYAPPFSPVWDPVLTAAKVLNGDLDSEPTVTVPRD